MLNFFAILISALIVSLVLGTILGILLTMHPSNNTRLKVAVLVLVRPVLHCLIMWPLYFSFFELEFIWILLMLAIVFAQELFFSTNRFLTKITVDRNTVEIECITPYLRRITVSDKADQLQNFMLSGASTIADYPPSLTFNHEGDEIKFIILSKDTWKDAKVVQSTVTTLQDNS